MLRVELFLQFQHVSLVINPYRGKLAQAVRADESIQAHTHAPRYVRQVPDAHAAIQPGVMLKGQLHFARNASALASYDKSAR